MAGATLQPVAPFVWNEVNSHHQEEGPSFYSQLLGWSTTDVDMGPMGTYTLFKQNENVGGIVRMKSPEWDGIPPHWSVYIHVSDVDVSARKAVELGGQVAVPPFDIPNVGRASVISDPDGASFYLFTPRAMG